MTDDSGGLFDHLDDPAPPLPPANAFAGVVARGQRIRRRRHAIAAGSAAVAVVVLGAGSVGLAAAMRAGGPTGLHELPAHGGSPTPTASEHRHHRHEATSAAVAGNQPGHPDGAVSPVRPSELPDGCPSPGPDTQPPLPLPSIDLPGSPAPSPDSCGTPGPTASPSASPPDSGSPSPAPSPSESPSAAPLG
ncbi:MAG: hypothetical protein JO222_07345 [Frankiales bacterium]|nr:hypothetical protein [Frankiales bacterium]